MTCKTGQPTLLIFTRGAKRERASRRLLPERLGEVELQLHQQCLDAACEAARQTGCRIAVSSPTPLDLPSDAEPLPQPGPHFGERLRLALNRTLERSQGPVLLVGTDIPGLTADHLGQALEYLQEEPDSVVLGPSPDGGFYLLGTNKSLDEELREVHWCGRDTLSSLRRQLDLSGLSYGLLPALADLDDRRDLERWMSRFDRQASAGGHRDADVWQIVVALLREALTLLRRLDVPATIGLPRLAEATNRWDRAPPPLP